MRGLRGSSRQCLSPGIVIIVRLYRGDRLADGIGIGVLGPFPVFRIGLCVLSKGQ
jgi:hypothetical protein